ncbi:SPASM domain-containing protein, partial [Candidatus Pacearchaeota archaeon]|nr:SPASM domain-containing protein [Candidatus Pacearchaeota archaeon]
NRTARSTISNDVVHRWVADVEYLVELGYNRLAMILIPDQEWSDEQMGILKSELRKISDFYIERYRQGKPIYIKHIEDAMKALVNPTRRSSHCGAGRSLVLIRTDGTIYPCHRFGGEIDAESENKWYLGSIFKDFDHEKRQLLLDLDCRKHVKADCENCMAVHLCGISCIALNWANFKDIYKPHSTQCKFNNLFFKEAMRIHYILDSERNRPFTKKFHPERYKNNRKPKGQSNKKTVKQQKTNLPEAVFVMLSSRALSPCFMFNGDSHKNETLLSMDNLKSVLKWSMDGDDQAANLFFLASETVKLEMSISKFLESFPEQIMVPLLSVQRQNDLQIPFSEKQIVVSHSLKQLVMKKESINGRPVIVHVESNEIEQIADQLLSIKDRIPQVTLRLRNAHELNDDQVEMYKKQLNTLKNAVGLKGILNIGGISRIHTNGANGQYRCPAGRQLVTVGPDGLVYPCPTFYRGGL